MRIINLITLVMLTTIAWLCEPLSLSLKAQNITLLHSSQLESSSVMSYDAPPSQVIQFYDARCNSISKNDLEIVKKIYSGHLSTSTKLLMVKPPSQKIASVELKYFGLAVVLVIVGWVLFLYNQRRTKKDTYVKKVRQKKTITDSGSIRDKSDSSGRDRPGKDDQIAKNNKPDSVSKDTDEFIIEEEYFDPGEEGENSSLFHDGSEADEGIDREFYTEVRTTALKHLADPNFKVKKLADKMGYSRRKFHRMMKEKTGETPHSILIAIRLEKARDLLINDPDLTIAEITYAVGMNKPSYMSKIFKEKYDITIRSFKAEVKKQKRR